MTDRKFWSFLAVFVAINLQLPKLLKRCNYCVVKVLGILASPQGFCPRFDLPFRQADIAIVRLFLAFVDSLKIILTLERSLLAYLPPGLSLAARPPQRLPSLAISLGMLQTPDEVPPVENFV